MPILHWRETLNHITILGPERMPALEKSRVMKAQNPSKIAGQGKGILPSSPAHPQKQNLVVYTEELTHLAGTNTATAYLYKTEIVNCS